MRAYFVPYNCFCKAFDFSTKKFYPARGKRKPSTFFIRLKKPAFCIRRRKDMVGSRRIELRTRGFSGLCSTD